MAYRRLFFFFKQKTAYDMRISDWSSDVCSSDLLASREVRPSPLKNRCVCRCRHRRPQAAPARPRESAGGLQGTSVSTSIRRPSYSARSEEHTSELQSLMRISYAVFCLKKKK